MLPVCGMGTEGYISNGIMEGKYERERFIACDE